MKYRFNLNEDIGVSLIALIITIIILIILAAVTLKIVIGESLVDTTTDVAVGYTKEGASEKLEMTLSTIVMKKIGDKSKYNSEEYLEGELGKEGIELIGDIAILNGWAFEIDREVPKIIKSLGRQEIPKFTNGFVAYFYEVYNNSTTSERYIEVVDYNNKYAELKDKTITIKESGEYTAFANVGRSSKEGYSTKGHIRINGELIKNSSNSTSFVWACSNNQTLSGIGSYTFTVEKNKPVTISYSISSDSGYGTSTSGSLVIVRRANNSIKIKDGLVATFSANYITSSTALTSIPIVECNDDYAQIENNGLKINEAGEYTVFGHVGRSSQHGFSCKGRLFIDNIAIQSEWGDINLAGNQSNRRDFME